MSTILESVNTLSEKLGVTEREQTIKDQLDLCVERLGGEGNSKDIAESAEKFAEKEDGTATFMTKTITENDTYNAADDGVSGYSSVTVNVAAPTPETFEVTLTLETVDGQTFSFTSSKTIQEAITAYNNGKKLSFIIQMVAEGNTITTTNTDYLYWDGLNTFLITFLTNNTSSGINYSIAWSSDSSTVNISTMMLFAN